MSEGAKRGFEVSISSRQYVYFFFHGSLVKENKNQLFTQNLFGCFFVDNSKCHKLKLTFNLDFFTCTTQLF